MLEIISKFDFDTLLIVSVFVTIFCVLILKYTPLKRWFDKDSVNIKSNDKKDYFVMFVAIAATFLQIGILIAKGQTFLWQEYLIKFLFTWAFSLLFYKILGMLFIKKLFDKGSDILIK